MNSITGDDVLCRYDLKDVITCAKGFSCLRRVSPGLGYTNFDNLPNAILVVIEIITLEGWVDTMYAVRHANNGS